MKNDQYVPLFTRVPESLRKAVRQEAANEDRSMSQVITSALRMYFKLPKGSAPRSKRK